MSGEDHLLWVVLDQQRMIMLMVGCQEQTMLMFGGNFIFLDHSRQVSKNVESEVTANGGLL